MDSRPLQLIVLAVAGWLHRHQAAQLAYLREENRVLKEQLGTRRLALTDAQRRRLAAKARVLGRRALLEVATIVTPDTLMRWYRRLIAQKYDGSRRRGRGRPSTSHSIAGLVVRFATENPTWGYTRIRGALAMLGHELGRTTIARILANHGIQPSPQRPLRWSTFLKAHWGAIYAADFVTVEVLTLRGLTRRHALFVMDLASRRVELAGIVAEPYEAWMKNAVRGLTDSFEGFLVHAKQLILDRDPVFTGDVRRMLEREGISVVRLPSRSPNLNAYCERFFGSLRRECLSGVIPLSETHLRRILQEYVEHYHAERPHQGLGNRPLMPESGANGDGPVSCTERLGGVLRFYHREVA